MPKPRGRPRKDAVGWNALPVPPSLPNYAATSLAARVPQPALQAGGAPPLPPPPVVLFAHDLSDTEVGGALPLPVVAAQPIADSSAATGLPCALALPMTTAASSSPSSVTPVATATAVTASVTPVAATAVTTVPRRGPSKGFSRNYGGGDDDWLELRVNERQSIDCRRRSEPLSVAPPLTDW